MSLQITDIPSKKINQSKLISTYENCLEKISNNKKPAPNLTQQENKMKSYSKRELNNSNPKHLDPSA